MNIFTYSDDAAECALWLDDKRKNKMILETAQLLCTTIRWKADPEWMVEHKHLPCYKAIMPNHPCSKWVRESDNNFFWLYTYWLSLLQFWGKPHGCYSVKEIISKYRYSFISFTGYPYSFVNCARNKSLGFDFTHLPVHEAYREYHKARWSNERPTWNKGERPEWFNGS